MATDDDTELDNATKREGGSERPKARTKRSGDPDSTEAKLARGTLIGRYVVLDVLGEGGMGVVYSAFDPELDRKVAIKLLQAGDGESTGQAWLLREAQALARLSHPNVVAVHDVGSLANDRVFVAMEQVDGQTLRRWLGTSRTWREVTEVMLSAGHGLAAAHRAGLVHRDFKPDNVLVGNDGRVRVMDFGLARLRPDDAGASGSLLTPASRDSDLRIESRSPLSERLTVVGTVVGTPAYMAPEIRFGDPADARGDQFAFGVALYEALYTHRPYTKEQLESGSAKPPTPPTSDVPAAIRRVVLRAISIPPADRYPSMDALLAELGVDPFARRKRAIYGGAAAGIVGGAIAVTLAMKGSPAPEQPPELCTGATKRLAGVWDTAAKASVEKAYTSTKLPVAAASFASLDKALDKLAAGWAATATENCEATRMRGEQTEDVMTLRQACLDQHLEDVRALIHELGDEPSAALVEKGDRVLVELDQGGTLARCSNVAALREPGRPPPELVPEVMKLTRALAEAKAMMITGKYLPALLAAQKTAEAARKVGWSPLVAEAEGVRGSALMAQGRFVDTAQAFSAATWAAFDGKRDDLIAAGAFSASMVTASGLGKPAEAKIWLALADAALARSNNSDRQLELRRSQVRGLVLAESGDLVGAAAAHEQTFKIAVAIYGKDSPGLFADELMFATTLEKAFRFKTAIPHFEHAIELRTKTVGAGHIDIAMMKSNLGISYRRIRDERKAHQVLEEALAMREKVYGKKSPLLVATLDNLTDLLRQERNYPAALAMITRAQELAAIIPGKEHPTWHQIATDHADVLVEAGKLAEARVLLDEVLALEDKTKTSVVQPYTQISRALLALAESRWAEAEAFAKLGVAGFEAAGGKTNPELVRALTALGRAEVGLGKPEAKATLERALAIAATTELHDDDLAATRAALARVPPNSR